MGWTGSLVPGPGRSRKHRQAPSAAVPSGLYAGIDSEPLGKRRMRIIYERALVFPLHGAGVSVAALERPRTDGSGLETQPRVQLLPC